MPLEVREQIGTSQHLYKRAQAFASQAFASHALKQAREVYEMVCARLVLNRYFQAISILYIYDYVKSFLVSAKMKYKTATVQ